MINNSKKEDNPMDNTPLDANDSIASEKTTETGGEGKTKNHEVDELKLANKELVELLQRTRADFENFRKRADEQKRFAEKLSAEKTVKSLLPLLDSLLLAIKANDSLLPLTKTLEKSLSEINLQMIVPAEGAVFNPNLHEALSMTDDGGDSEVVSELLQPGYIYNGNVIRAALVKVKTV